MNVFTFWEGKMPEYIAMCMNTWDFSYTILNYENLNRYTHLSIDALKRFTLPQIADIVRVHVLRDNGGYWLDADTIMLSETLPHVNIMGEPDTRINTIGYLYTTPQTIQMFEDWAKYQDSVIADSSQEGWDIVGNRFTDQYLKEHLEVSIGQIRNKWPETYMIKNDAPRRTKYVQFYFESSYYLSDLEPTNMLMLHNSWTPEEYKILSEMEVLEGRCTLSNILREMT